MSSSATNTRGDDEDFLENLRTWDRRLQEFACWRTLDPHAETPTPLAVLGSRFDGFSKETRGALGHALTALVEAAWTHFPENIFWDFDGVTEALRTAALEDSDGAVVHLGEWARLVAELHELFGQASPIRFRYTHDLLYGFDWARWVAKDPMARQGIGPYDLAFLRAMFRRGGELLRLIDENDSKYGPLPSGEPRNPFTFSREPAEEFRLHRTLAAQGFIPVPAWEAEGKPQWQKPFATVREQRALEMGIAKGGRQPWGRGTGTPMPT
jgi:hypothetical protein